MHDCPTRNLQAHGFSFHVWMRGGRMCSGKRTRNNPKNSQNWGRKEGNLPSMWKNSKFKIEALKYSLTRGKVIRMVTFNCLVLGEKCGKLRHPFLHFLPKTFVLKEKNKVIKNFHPGFLRRRRQYCRTARVRLLFFSSRSSSPFSHGFGILVSGVTFWGAVAVPCLSPWSWGFLMASSNKTRAFHRIFVLQF